MPDSSCLLMMERVAWGGYNCGRKIKATAEILRNHFSLACSPQSGMGIVYVKHRTNRMRINFSPRLSNNKGWTERLFSVGRRKGANIPEWDFPVRVVEPLRKADMPPFLIKEAAAASQSLNMIGANHAEGYLTEYKLVKCKLSRAWDDEEIAAGRDQKEMANYAEMIHVSLCSIRLDEGGSAKGPAQKAKAVARGGAVKEALETATTAGATSLPQTKRKEKRKAAMVESQAEGRTSEEEVSYEPRARKKKKATKSMLHIAESAAAVEDEEEDREPLLARSSRQRTGTPEERASATLAVDRSKAVMKMSAELGLIMPSTNELGNASLGMTGAWAPLHPIRTETWDRTGRGGDVDATTVRDHARKVLRSQPTHPVCGRGGDVDGAARENLAFKELEGVVAYMHGYDRSEHPVCYNAYEVFKGCGIYSLSSIWKPPITWTAPSLSIRCCCLGRLAPVCAHGHWGRAPIPITSPGGLATTPSDPASDSSSMVWLAIKDYVRDYVDAYHPPQTPSAPTPISSSGGGSLSTSSFNKGRYNDGPNDELPLESIEDYPRELGYLQFSDFRNATSNTLNRVWYKREEIFPVDGVPKQRQHAFWVPASTTYFDLSKKLSGSSSS
ncbi:hypothetical protein Taro_009374 [Colocasia esculenta]|uniref:Uncharacterized protein n=1 Tax=Colocasia esculenta TaxID=4460 RepID=A0A843U5J1_COLES|nr:hypothetical protein [Colocasia esculenta]